MRASWTELDEGGILILPAEPVPQGGLPTAPPSSPWGLQKPPRDRPTRVRPSAVP